MGRRCGFVVGACVCLLLFEEASSALTRSSPISEENVETTAKAKSF